MKRRLRNNLKFVAGGIAALLIAGSILTGIVYVLIVTVQTLNAD